MVTDWYFPTFMFTKLLYLYRIITEFSWWELVCFLFKAFPNLEIHYTYEHMSDSKSTVFQQVWQFEFKCSLALFTLVSKNAKFISETRKFNSKTLKTFRLETKRKSVKFEIIWSSENHWFAAYYWWQCFADLNLLHLFLKHVKPLGQK